jgi:DMSO/TMAO reductase YedYZ molybdopterin-dependent catalytic subunit
MMSRRRWLAGLPVVGGLAAAGCRTAQAPTYGSIFDLSNAATFAAHRWLLRNQPLVREFPRSRITKNFPAINTTNPDSDRYQRLLAGRFADWRLPVEGLVANRLQLSLGDLKRLPPRTQVTQHSCEQGWSAIAEWTGVPLAAVLKAAGTLPGARYVVFHTVDGWWDSVDMFDALHPQTLLAYGMNGTDLPVPHGAPVRLRVERQLGYKHLKFLTRLTLTDNLEDVEDGTGAVGAAYGYSWYAGI